jgi:hypothetical protein
VVAPAVSTLESRRARRKLESFFDDVVKKEPGGFMGSGKFAGVLVLLVIILFGCSGGGGGSGSSSSKSNSGGSSTGGVTNPVCSAGNSSGPVQRPAFIRNLKGQTGWFAAPVVADLDGDGQLEILIQTFDHGLDIFTVPGSGCNCMLWTTARGGPLRMGAPNGN